MNERPKSIHYRITQYFLSNHRLTVLSLIALVGLGIFSVLMLKTTGFPSAEIKFVLVQSVYPGASAEAMMNDVTQPLEGAIKNISGIESYSSRSLDSFSSISIQVSQSANTDSVRSQIDSAVRSVSLPDSVSPKVFSPDFSNADLVLSVSADSIEEMYALSERLTKDIQEIQETRSVEPAIALQKQLRITIDSDRAREMGVTVNAIRSTVSGLGELLPVASGLTIDSEQQSMVTTFPEVTRESIQNVSVQSLTGGTVRLGDIVALDTQYAFEGGEEPLIGLRDHEGHTAVVPAVTLFIKTVKDIDQTAFVNAVHERVAAYEGVRLIVPGEETTDRSEPWVIQHYSSSTFNQNQVNEVIGGLIGAPLETDSIWKHAGWILGGIQLVFLVMLAFVSWRAAIIAAAAIPLSLVFSTIYIYLIGEQLNTLVLFSLVLVIGLVVDPALVILESIQRKIDIGLRGKAAALAAMEDVGQGLFMATLTNIIVFLPFGLISGFLGKFFIFIPYTIIPATIGSYLVPVVFLAWMGGLFLRKSKHKSEDEEKNLWSVSRWVIRANERMLASAWWVRTAFIGVAFSIPMIVVGVLFSSNAIKVVQFASSSNPNYLNISGEYRPSAVLSERNLALREVVTEAIAHDGVQQIYPLTSGLYYFVNLEKGSEREIVSPEIAQSIQEEIKNIPAFFDIKTRIDQVGPPVADYEIAISVRVDNQDQARAIAEDIGAHMPFVCSTTEGNVEVGEKACEGGAQSMITKIDDGYTNKTQKVIQVTLNRQKLQELKLIIANAPQSAIVNRILRDSYLMPDDAEIKTLSVSGEEMMVVLSQTQNGPDRIEDIRNTIVAVNAQGVVRLGDIATVESVESPASITRVNGQTLAVVQGRLAPEFADQQTASAVTQAIVDYYKTERNGALLTDRGLHIDDIDAYSEGSTAENIKSFQDLFVTLILAIALTYLVLALFFKSFALPVVILFTIPLTFLGIFPALAVFVGGQFGFLEIIGLIILVGIVENVAIFLIDAARQKIDEGWDAKRAISYAAGIRFRPILLTKFTAIASLMPLAIFSEIYRSIAVLIMFGLLTSGFTSLFTTPILFIFFRWLGEQFARARFWQKVLIIVGFPIALIVLVFKDRTTKK